MATNLIKKQKNYLVTMFELFAKGGGQNEICYLSKWTTIGALKPKIDRS